MDLVAFLRARLDADEQIARAAIADDGGQDDGFEDATWLDDGRLLPRFGEAAADLIRAFAVPRRVLAEVEAKRQMIALHSAEEGQHPDFCWHDKHELPCPTLRLLALPHADHPEHRAEWRP